MGMRRHCFEDCAFDVRLGPVGTTNYQHEETGLIQTLLDRGLQGLWVKDAQVQHFIPKSRLTEKYIWRFHWCYGRTWIRRCELVPGNEILGIPRWLVREYLQNVALCMFWSTMKNERWIEALKRAAIDQGIISEIREQRRGSREVIRRPT
jgi:hypothetical protein